MDNGQKLLRLAAVVNMTGLARSTIYAEIQKKRFPKQVKISARSSAWYKKEIDDWIAERLKERDEGDSDE